MVVLLLDEARDARVSGSKRFSVSSCGLLLGLALARRKFVACFEKAVRRIRRAEFDIFLNGRSDKRGFEPYACAKSHTVRMPLKNMREPSGDGPTSP
jgi:hypothetical protein